VRFDARGHQKTRLTLYAGRTDFNPHDQTLNSNFFVHRHQSTNKNKTS
jgi:hypothetical protein